MTLLVEKGTFAKTTTTPGPTSQTVNLTNSSLTPKFAIFWVGGHTAFDAFQDDARFSYGFCALHDAAYNQACQAYRADESGEIESYNFRNNSCISIHSLTAASEISAGNVTSFAAGQFTINWGIQTDTSAINIHYMVVGGTDIINANVINTTVLDFNSGNHSWTGSGTTFTPDFCLTMTGADSYSTVNSFASGIDVATISIGAVKSTTNQWVVAGRDETVSISDTDQYIDNAACLANLDNANGPIDYLANFVSFDNAAGGGITLNVTNTPTSSTQRLAFLVIKGGSWDCAVFQQRSGTGTQDVTLPTNFDPSLVFLGGINTTLEASVEQNFHLCFGASDGTNEGCTYFGNTSGNGTWAAVRNDSNTKVYRQATPNATATSSTINAECDMNDMATLGKFQLNWTTADTTLRQMAYWTLGTISAGQNINVAPATEALTLSESLTLVRGRVRTISQSLALSESLTRRKGSIRTVAQTLTLGESVTKSKGRERLVFEPANTQKSLEATNHFITANSIHDPSLGVGIAANSGATFAVWYKPIRQLMNINNSPAEIIHILDFYSLPDYYEVAIDVNYLGQVDVYAMYQDDSEVFSNPSHIGQLTLDKWVHVGVTVDDLNNLTKAYIDGSEVFSATSTAPLKTGTDYQIFPPYNAYARLSDWRMYNRALSGSEMTNLAGGQNITSGLVHQWKFDNNVNDSIGSVHGTITGGTQLYSIDIPPPFRNKYTVGEAIAIVRNKTRTIAQTLTLGESVSRQKSATRAIAQTLTLSDAAAKVKGVTRTVSQTLTLGESLARTMAKTRTISQSLTLGETLTRLKAASRSISQTLALSDAVVRSKGLNRSISQTLTLGESLMRTMAKTRAISQTLTLSESLTRLKAANRSIAQTLALSEALARSKGSSRSIAQSLTLGESLTRMAAKTRAISQTLTLGESLTRMVGKTRTISQTLTLADLAEQVKFSPPSGIVRTASDTLTLSDSVSRKADKFRAISQSLTLGESVVRTKGANRSIAQSLTLSEALARVRGIIRSISQTLTLSENLARMTAKTRAISQTLALGESLTRTKAMTRAVPTQSLILSDAVVRFRGRVRALSETLILGESLNRQASKTRTISQSLTLSEQLMRIKSLNRSISQTLTLGESLARISAKTRAIAQTLTLGESLTRTMAKKRSISQTLTISDLAAQVLDTGAADIIKTISQTLTLSDSVTRKADKKRTIIQGMSLQDLLQGFLNGVPMEPPTIPVTPTIKGLGAGLSYPTVRRFKRIFIVRGTFTFEVVCKVLLVEDCVFRAIRFISIRERLQARLKAGSFRPKQKQLVITRGEYEAEIKGPKILQGEFRYDVIQTEVITKEQMRAFKDLLRLGGAFIQEDDD